MKVFSVTFAFQCDDEVYAALTLAPPEQVVVALPALGLGWSAPNIPAGGYIGPPQQAMLTHRAPTGEPITRVIRLHGKKGLDIAPNPS